MKSMRFAWIAAMAMTLSAMLTLSACGGDDSKKPVDGQCPAVLEEVDCTQPLTTDLTLDGQVMTCTGDLSVRARLTLVNGSRLEAGQRVFVEQGGALVAEGTADCPIRFTSAQDTPAAGDWTYINIKDDADNASMLTHAIVEYGGNEHGIISLDYDAQIGLDHVTIQHTEQVGMSGAKGAFSVFRDVHFDHIPDAAFTIHPDNAAVIESVTMGADVQEPFIDVVAQGKNDMTVDGTWEDLGVPYRLFGDISFEAELIVTAGTRLLIAQDQRFFVTGGGSIKTQGTVDDPVVIESANQDGRPGDWRHFGIRPEAASDTTFSHTTIAHGGGGGHGAIDLYSGSEVTFDNVAFSDNQDCDVDGDGSATVNISQAPFVSCE